MEDPNPESNDKKNPQNFYEQVDWLVDHLNKIPREIPIRIVSAICFLATCLFLYYSGISREFLLLILSKIPTP